MATSALNAVVMQRIEHAPGLMTIRVAPDRWELPDFTPGQYVVLGLPGSAPRCPTSDPDSKPPDPDKLIRRAYSITSSSVASEYLEFYISLVRSGELTPRLFNLNIGDRLWLSSKSTGYFTLDGVPPEMNVVMVATGTGLAPYMSMIRSELITHKRQGRFAVIHGAYHSWDLGYHGELVMLERLSPTFKYIPVISNPEEEPVPWSGETGFVQRIWREGMVEKVWGVRPRPDNTHVFLCGHPDMIDSMEGIIKEAGFAEHTRKSPGQYHVERY
ncbi:MAG: ferredoxin--NADP reductase [Planctomycetes bacterium]|nr:ferredoxin--NADP reductase [Planctomycetota bacterium]